MKTENFMRSPNYYQHYTPFFDVCQMIFIRARYIIEYACALARVHCGNKLLKIFKKFCLSSKKLGYI